MKVSSLEMVLGYIFFSKIQNFQQKKQKLNIYICISKELIDKVFSGEPYLTFP